MRVIGPQEFEGRKIVILGLGRQGKALARFFARAGAHVVISDVRSADALAAEVAELEGLGVTFALGGHPLTLLDGADLLCLSGGVPPTIPIVQEARRRGIPLSNDTLLTLQLSPAPVLGITGSAGKTTTTTLTGLMLEEAGITAHVGGNIGTPLIDRLEGVRPTDWLVLELSSFQLELCRQSPRVAAVLNVTPNHLDRHPSMEAYAEAKRNIFRYQKAGDTVVLGWDNDWTRGWWHDAVPTGVRRLAFSLEGPVPEGAYLDGDVLRLRLDGREETICRVEELRLRGRHNVANVLAAATLAAVVGAEVEAITAVARRFEGVPHRLEIVAEWKGALWVNDSIATAPERVVAALRSFKEPIVLLAGGRDKHLPWEEFAQEAAQRVRHVIAFGEIAPLVNEVLMPYVGNGHGRLETVEQVTDLEAAVKRAAMVVRAGDIVLLSPGGTSFDAYRNFEERGEHFRRLVRALVEGEHCEQRLPTPA